MGKKKGERKLRKVRNWEEEQERGIRGVDEEEEWREEGEGMMKQKNGEGKERG